ncbi:MAG: hypothetical protein ACJA1I_000813 [Zhongshania marina]|jgi:hypothetical protein|tara:strand:- start:356 stop:610 length:255 start_codon:yes stop_codon:yes gene_type:complete
MHNLDDAANAQAAKASLDQSTPASDLGKVVVSQLSSDCITLLLHFNAGTARSIAQRKVPHYTLFTAYSLLGSLTVNFDHPRHKL